jgi:hypothetical protein
VNKERKKKLMENKKEIERGKKEEEVKNVYRKGT